MLRQDSLVPENQVPTEQTESEESKPLNKENTEPPAKKHRPSPEKEQSQVESQTPQTLEDSKPLEDKNLEKPIQPGDIKPKSANASRKALIQLCHNPELFLCSSFMRANNETLQLTSPHGITKR